MSLERLVKEFAERVRAELLARIEAEKDNDTAVVKWQGFNADGNPIVKNLDKIDTAKGLGNVAQKKGTKLIYDKNSSAEYRKRKKKKPALVKKQDVPSAPRRRRISRTPLLTADLFPSVISKLFNIPSIAYMIMTYFTGRPSQEYDYFPSSDLYAGQIYTGSYSGYFGNATSKTYTATAPAYTNAASGKKTYRVSMGGLSIDCVYYPTSTPSTAEASASITGLGLDLTASVSASGPGYTSEYELVTAIVVRETTEQETVTVQVDGQYAQTTYSSNLHGSGAAAAQAFYIDISFPATTYYVQMSNDADTDESRIRTIDLSFFVDKDIFEHKMIHEYVAREGNDVFVYSIFLVKTCDMSQEQDIIDTYQPLGYYDYKHKNIGKIARYVIHTRLNMNTGSIEKKVNESTHAKGFYTDGTPSPYTNDARQHTGTWLLDYEVYAGGGGFQQENYVGIRRNFQTIGSTYPGNHSFPGGYNSWQDSSDMDGFDVELIWKESYPGDWIYAYRNIAWARDPNSSMPTSYDIQKFLWCSFKNGFFDLGSDYNYDNYNSQFTFVYDPAGTSLEGNPDSTDLNILRDDIWGKISYFYQNVYRHDYYYGPPPNGGRPTEHSDYSSWRPWFDSPTDITNYSYHPAPNYTIDSRIVESATPKSNPYTPFGNMMFGLWQHDVPIPATRIKSYSITDEVVDLTTALPGMLLAVDDIVNIYAPGEFVHGLFAVTEVISNTRFKVFFPGSGNTVFYATPAIAYKLPPAT